eukprot:TRINITY_DN2376_c0_g1_i2.p2 TRINITY_DN2376_c0_g1~~TRINITY_DN2376_c0_g1_i2.p2  ORF type:complete len:125 (+),score=31.98 TRINITY_DN2376_c0_g1_i2:194-568(+)
MLGASQAQAAKGTAEDPARPLKKYIVERATECINSTSRLAHDLNKACQADAVARLPRELAEKNATIIKTSDLLKQMPLVIMELDTHLDVALTSAAGLSKAKEILQTNLWEGRGKSSTLDPQPSK